MTNKIRLFLEDQGEDTVKLEILADINFCEFVILEVFALLKFANLGLSKVNFLFPTNSVLLLLLEIGYILDV